MIDFKNSTLELWHFRELLWALILREIKIRYKQTLLGAAWAILQPASLTIIFTIVFGIFLKMDSKSVPYPVFAYSALLPWTFFSTSITFGSLSVVNNGNLVTKVYFPREILPLASVGAAFFDFLMAAIVFILLMIFYHIQISYNIIFSLPIIASVFLLTTGISFFFSALNVLFRDIKFVIPLLLQVWLYITPVIYSSGQVPPQYRFYLSLNPLTQIIESFRDLTIYKQAPNIDQILLSITISITIFLTGYWFFKKKEKIFADVM